MTLDLIQMNPNEAMEAYQSYHAATRRTHDKIDKALTRGYKALSKGKKLININSTLRRAGLGEDGLPRLAIIRADATYCYIQSGRSYCEFVMSRDHQHCWTRQCVRIPGSVFPDLRNISLWNSPRAIVPIVPPPLRPRFRLSNYHILWEADWEMVPVDPVLLKHVHGALYEVIAQWDLTPLEQAVMEEYLV